MTNQPTGNTVIEYRRANDGALTKGQELSTGGAGGTGNGVGFSMLFASLRESSRVGEPSKYDVLLTGNFPQLGFIIVLGSLLPSLLGFFLSSDEIIAHRQRAATAVPLALYAIPYLRRRRRATGTPLPVGVWLNVSLLYIALAMLLWNAALGSLQMGTALHALALTVVLFSSFPGFLLALSLLFREPERPMRDNRER